MQQSEYLTIQKNNIKLGEKISGLQETSFLYALANKFIQLRNCSLGLIVSVVNYTIFRHKHCDPTIP